MLIIGVSSIFFAGKYDYLVVCLIGQTLFGIGKSLGDVVIHGFVKGFPGEAFGGYTIGQGVAGIILACQTIAFKYYDIKVYQIFLWMIPMYFVFYLVFQMFINIKMRYDECF